MARSDRRKTPVRRASRTVWLSWGAALYLVLPAARAATGSRQAPRSGRRTEADLLHATRLANRHPSGGGCPPRGHDVRSRRRDDAVPAASEYVRRPARWTVLGATPASRGHSRRPTSLCWACRRAGRLRATAAHPVTVQAAVHQLDRFERDVGRAGSQLGAAPLHWAGLLEHPLPLLFTEGVLEYHGDHLSLDLASQHVLIPGPELRFRQTALQNQP